MTLTGVENNLAIGDSFRYVAAQFHMDVHLFYGQGCGYRYDKEVVEF